MAGTRVRILVLLALLVAVLGGFALFGPHLSIPVRFDGKALARRVEALEPLMAAAGFLYGVRAGALLSWAGIVLGASACFLLARRYGRPFVLRFVRAERLAGFDAALERGPLLSFGAVLFLRVFAFTSFDVVSYAFGLTKIPLQWFVLATAIGGVPKALAFSALGAGAGSTSAWLGWTIVVGTLGAVGLAPFLLWMRRRN